MREIQKESNGTQKLQNFQSLKMTNWEFLGFKYAKSWANFRKNILLGRSI